MRPRWIPDLEAWTPWQFLASNGLRRIISGPLFGEQRPPRRPPEATPVDARTHALEALKAYLAEVWFRIPDPSEEHPGRVLRYRLEPSRILVEEPEDSNTRLLFPRIVFMPGQGEYLPRGLSPIVFEETWHRHGHETVLTCSHEYQERFVVECWATTRAQRRSLAAGVEWALSTPQEQNPGIRLRLPGYFGATAAFQLEERLNLDDEESEKRRRRAQVTCSLRVDLLRLTTVQELKPRVQVLASDEAGPVQPPK